MLSPEEKINLFNSKVDRLVNSIFVDYNEKNPNQKIEFKAIRREDEKFDITSSSGMPGEKEIDGFILTLRQFLQNNDPISLNNMKQIYDSLSIPLDLKEQFNNLRDSFNSWLNKTPDIKITLNNQELTRRKILCTLLYGYYAHSNEEKSRIVNFWKKELMLWPLIQINFINILNTTLQTLYQMKNINIKTLKHIVVS